MTSESAQWLHRQTELSVVELCEFSGLPESLLRELVDYGALMPVDPGASAWTFSADRLVLARSANRLRRDFDLDAPGVALALTLLERVRELETELCELRARLPGGGS